MAQRKRRSIYGLAVLLLVLIVTAVAVTYFSGKNVAVLNPKGIIAQEQKNLFIIGILLSAIIVIPVFIMTAVIAYKYREGNRGASYQPDWDGSRLYESLWWGIPFIIIGILSVITWNSSHSLEPGKPLASPVQPLHIQVISLDWKWLFIYPDQNIASVNYLQLPLNTPVSFKITSDSVMNSFWVPQLGGQIYAVPGMTSSLNLMASQAGDFRGSSANISGSGFSGMNFLARAGSAPDFDAWVTHTRRSPVGLTEQEYAVLAKPSKYSLPVFYSSATRGLFDSVIMKYKKPVKQLRPQEGRVEI